MRIFEERSFHEAIEWAESGGQALHLMRPMKWINTPLCFKNSKQWAHLFDNDRERLIKTARELGVSKIVVHHEGTRRQHIDLCGRPLERAKKGE